MRLAGFSFALASLLIAGVASADDRRVVAVMVDGTIDLSAALPKTWSVSNAASFNAAMRALGQTTPVGKALKSGRRDALIERARKAAVADNDEAVLLVSVERQRKARLVTIVLVDPAHDTPTLDTTVTLPASPSASDAQKLMAAIAGPLDSIPATKPTPKATTPETPQLQEVLAPAPPPPADEAERTSGDPTRAIADLSVGVLLGSRHFSYKDAIGRNLRPYDVDAAPMLGVAMELHPFTDTPVLKEIGFYGDFSSAIALASATQSGAAVGTQWARYDIGGRVRVRVGNHERPVMFGASGGYGLEIFRFTDATTIDPQLPSVSYGFIRGLLDVRVPIGPVALSAAIGYLHVVANGDVGLRVRGTRNAGVEATVGAAVPFAHAFEARLSGTYTRFFYSFDPVPGDTYVAGGALDQFLTGKLALAWMY